MVKPSILNLNEFAEALHQFSVHSGYLNYSSRHGTAALTIHQIDEYNWRSTSLCPCCSNGILLEYCLAHFSILCYAMRYARTIFQLFYFDEIDIADWAGVIEWLPTMAIKLFQFVQKLYHKMGIHSMQQSNGFFSRKSLFSLKMVLATASYFGYFLLDSSNAGEYGQNFYRSMTMLNTLIDYFITMWKMPAITKMIKMCEKFIDNSESNEF